MRFNVYGLIHKTIRGQFGELVVRAGKTVWTDPASVKAMYEGVYLLEFVLQGHAHREDTVLHPVLKAEKYLRMGDLEIEHITSDKQLNEVVASITAINTDCAAGLKDGLVARGFEFYLQLAQYMATYFLHMNHEETMVLPFLQSKKTDVELLELHKAMQASLTAEDVLCTISVMFPYMSSGEAAMIVKLLSNIYPSQFPDMAHEIKRVLGEGDTTLIFKLATVEFPRVKELEGAYVATTGMFSP